MTRPDRLGFHGLSAWHTNLSQGLDTTPKLHFLATGRAACVTEWSSPRIMAVGATFVPVLRHCFNARLVNVWFGSGDGLPASWSWGGHLRARHNEAAMAVLTAYVPDMSRSPLLFGLGLTLTLAGAAPNHESKDLLPPAPAGMEWKLVWHDEFEGATLDETKWNRLGDWKRRDGFWVKEDAYLSGKGTLILRTRKDGDRYTCGAVNTQGKFEHAFGFYVARCKAPRQPGHWPAFWMMSSGVGKVGDEGRDGTEIDIMEMPWRDGKVTFNLHWDGYGKDHKSAGTNTVIPALMEGFHDYALLWTPEEYVFSIDGREVWRTRAGGVSQVPEFLKLTEEIGKWGGDITKAELPDYFEVEYVRVYALGK